MKILDLVSNISAKISLLNHAYFDNGLQGGE